MILPKNLRNTFEKEIQLYEEEKQMRYVTSIERFAREDALIDILEIRFNTARSELEQILEPIDDYEQLKMLLRKAVTIGSLDEFKQLVDELISQPEKDDN